MTTNPSNYAQAMRLLRQPSTRLVRTHPRSEAIIGRDDVRAYDAGLLPDHPQSWSLQTG
jgi:hypothetical protein